MFPRRVPAMEGQLRGRLHKELTALDWKPDEEANHIFTLVIFSKFLTCSKLQCSHLEMGIIMIPHQRVALGLKCEHIPQNLAHSDGLIIINNNNNWYHVLTCPQVSPTSR